MLDGGMRGLGIPGWEAAVCFSWLGPGGSFPVPHLSEGEGIVGFAARGKPGSNQHRVGTGWAPGAMETGGGQRPWILDLASHEPTKWRPKEALPPFLHVSRLSSCHSSQSLPTPPPCPTLGTWVCFRGSCQIQEVSPRHEAPFRKTSHLLLPLDFSFSSQFPCSQAAWRGRVRGLVGGGPGLPPPQPGLGSPWGVEVSPEGDLASLVGPPQGAWWGG